MSTLLRLVLAVVLATQAFIDLQLRADLPGWTLDAPIADLGGVLLVALLPWLLARRVGPRSASDHRLLWLASAAGLAVLLLASAGSDDPMTSLKYVLRKPIFFGVAYLIALPLALERVSRSALETGMLLILGAVALVSLVTSTGRILAGQGFWWQSLDGLTPNHKTLAVWMAPFVPWLVVQRGRRLGWIVLVLVAVAILFTSAKAAWVTALFGAAWCVCLGGRPLVTRVRTTVLTLGMLGLLSVAAPMALQSAGLLATIQGATPLGLQARMALDATRSRQSLNLRSWQMFTDRPLLGQGPGASTRVEMVTFPHYRINGVDAHGAVQKIGSETGLLGLAAGGFWLTALARSMRRRWTGRLLDTSWAWLGVAAALHLNLLSSTETWSMTHWIPLGLAWWGVGQGNRDIGCET